MKRFFLVLVVLLLLCSVTFADNETKHPIDLEREKRLGTAQTTGDMIEVLQWAAGEWDKLLNENYKALMQNLEKEQQEKLRASQREWIKFRDMEFDFNESYNSDYGTMAGINISAFQCSFVRERALALGIYLKSDEEDLD